mgnify:CR=1 FL=1
MIFLNPFLPLSSYLSIRFFLSPFLLLSYLRCFELRVSSYASGIESIGFYFLFLLTGKGFSTHGFFLSHSGHGMIGGVYWRERLDLWHGGLRRTW